MVSFWSAWFPTTDETDTKYSMASILEESSVMTAYTIMIRMLHFFIFLSLPVSINMGA